MGYINDEHSSLIAAHTVDEDSTRIFRSFKKNTSAFTPEDVNHLALAANIAVLKNSKSDKRSQRGGRQQVYHPPYQNQYSTPPQTQYRHPGNYHNFQLQARFYSRVPDTNWHNVESVSYQQMPPQRPPRPSFDQNSNAQSQRRLYD